MTSSTRHLILGFAWFAAEFALAGERFAFERRVLDAKVGVGYGVAIEDVDADGKLDILLADAREFVWYRNPEFKRLPLLPALSERDNVAIAARRFSATGQPCLAFGGAWNPSDTTSPGRASVVSRYELFGGATFSSSQRIDFDAEPTLHRLRFIDLLGTHDPDSEATAARWALVIVPLHGRADDQGAPAPAQAFAHPVAPGMGLAGSRELIDGSLFKTHNFDIGQWDPSTPGEELLLIGDDGAKLCVRANGQWTSRALEGVRGGGEIRMGRRADGTRILATVEPMHGNLVALYTENAGGSFSRRVFDDSLNQAHALAVADLDGDGEPEVICGWREKDEKGETGINLYSLEPDAKPHRLDSSIACEDLVVADLDADGRPDIVAAGRASHDLVLFTNRADDSKTPRLATDESIEFEAARVAYRRFEGNDPTQPPLVFVHGWSCDKSVWNVPLTVTDLPASIETRTRIAIDLPGHGESAMPLETPTFSAYTRAIAAVLERERAERAVLVGHSNGVPIVRHFARLFPDRVVALVLIDGPLRRFVPDGDATRAMAERFVGPDSESFANGMIEGTVSKALPGDLRADLLAMMKRVPGATRRDSFLASLDAEVWKPDPITVPLLMVNAAQPSWSAEYVEFVKGLAPGVEYVEWQGASHFLMCERPVEFLTALDAFLARLE